MIFSMGTAGCNLGCMFCQNWSMSKSRSDLDRSGELDPRSVVAGAIQHGCPSIAFTYNEPTIWGSTSSTSRARRAPRGCAPSW